MIVNEALNEGPRTELLFWKKKLQNYILLSDMINSEDC